jgi:hypothetical protein
VPVFVVISDNASLPTTALIDAVSSAPGHQSSQQLTANSVATETTADARSLRDHISSDRHFPGTFFVLQLQEGVGFRAKEGGQGNADAIYWLDSKIR